MRIMVWIFWVFVIGSTVWRYSHDPPMPFDPAYFASVGILSALTTVLPWLITGFAIDYIRSPARYAVALILPMIVAVLGYSIYFGIFLAPQDYDIDFFYYMPRGSMWGGFVGLILLVDEIMKARRKGKP